MRTMQLCRVGAVAVVATLAGCGDGGTENDESSVGAGPTSSSAPPSIVRTAIDAALGTIVVDAQGMTLYRNAQETGTTIACTGACAAVWPPLLAPGGFEAGGMLASIPRPDGGSQVSYGGTPLYRYVEDKAAGETKGHGVGGIWFVVPEAGSPGTVATTTTAAIPAAGVNATTTRPTTTTTRAGTRPGTPVPGGATTSTTAAGSATTVAATTPPTTSPPATPAPTAAPAQTSPPPTYTPTTGGSCDYPPCDP